MTQLQYLLIHSVWNGAEPIWWVATDDKEEQGVWFGFRFPYDDKEEIVTALDELCQRNLISLEVFENWRESDNYIVVENPTTDFIRSGFNDRSIYYSLTAKGGVLWEKEFKVDWDKYVQSRMRSGRDKGYEEVALTSSSLNSLDVYLKEVFRVYSEVEPEQRTVEELKDWQVTYWKTLPVAYKTTCWVIRKPPEEILPFNETGEVVGWIIKWYDDTPLGFKR